MTEIAMFRSAVIDEIDGASYFRVQKAEEYPDDDRNQQCAESLGALQQNMADLREDDPALRKCFEVYRDKLQAAGNSECDLYIGGLWFPSDEHSGYSVSKPVFSRYGFDGPKSGDAQEFLASLSEEIEGWDVAELRLDELV